jgi:hypothetical protein
MTDKIVEATPVPPSDWGHSDTAATVGKALYGPSGAMDYRVTMGDGRMAVVNAATGDDAAARALARLGGKVVLVEPAPQVDA